MTKKKNILLTQGSLHVPRDQILSIDIEGAPHTVKQVAIYDFNHQLLYDQTASGKELPMEEIGKIQRILNRARVLVGHSVDSDLTALRKRGVYLYNDTRCLDTYFTMLELKKQRLLEGTFGTASLKDTAEYFHIHASDYHTSHTDALAAAVVLEEMMNYKDGMVVEITPSMIQIPRPAFEAAFAMDGEEREDMSWYQTNSRDSPREGKIYQNGNFYECVIQGTQGVSFVRMTQEEYDLLCRIRELRPDYSVKMYTESILTPAIVSRLEALAREEEAVEIAVLPEEPLSDTEEGAESLAPAAAEAETEEQTAEDVEDDVPSAMAETEEPSVEMAGEVEPDEEIESHEELPAETEVEPSLEEVPVEAECGDPISLEVTEAGWPAAAELVDLPVEAEESAEATLTEVSAEVSLPEEAMEALTEVTEMAGEEPPLSDTSASLFGEAFDIPDDWAAEEKPAGPMETPASPREAANEPSASWEEDFGMSLFGEKEEN